MGCQVFLNGKSRSPTADCNLVETGTTRISLNGKTTKKKNMCRLINFQLVAFEEDETLRLEFALMKEQDKRNE